MWSSADFTGIMRSGRDRLATTSPLTIGRLETEEGTGILRWSLPVRILAYVPLLVVAHVLGYELRLPAEDLTTFWPPAGAALAILAFEPKRLWGLHALWLLALDVFMDQAVYGWSDHPAWALYFASVNVTEAMLAVWVLARMGLLPLDCSRVWSYAGFTVAVCFFVPILSGLLGAAGVAHLTEQPFDTAWVKWWLGDALGLLIVGPAVLGLLHGSVTVIPKSRSRAEAGAFGLLFLSAGALTCRTVSPVTAEMLHLQHVAVPFLIWAALRFNWQFVAWTLLVSGALIVLEAHVGVSPFGVSGSTGIELVHSVQLYLAATGIPSMLLGAFVVGLRDRNSALSSEMRARELAEARRGELERALQSAQQAEVVGRLASGVAHDMNNMLTVLSWHTEVLERLHKDDPESRRSIEGLRHAANHAGELTRSLLTMSRRSEAQRERVDLVELIQTTLPLVERAVPRGVNVSFEGDSAPVILLGDKSQLRQVLVNLCLNGGDAMKEYGGNLGLRLQHDRAPEPTCTLTVSDEGYGMSEVVQQRVFEPFFSTKGSAGTGLGLCVVQSVVKDHGGSVGLSSTVGKGTTFSLTLPVLSEPEQGLDLEEVPHGHGELVLILDDDDQLRDLMSRSLSRHGYESIEVKRGERVLELAERGTLFADVFVFDVRLSGLSGIECLRRLRARGDDTPAILITADQGGETVMGEKLGALLIEKPFSMLDLVRAVYGQLDSSEDPATVVS